MSSQRLYHLARPCLSIREPFIKATVLASQRPFSTGASNLVSSYPASRAASSSDAPYVKGTVNDPTPFPTPNKAHGSIHWTFERSLSAALIPVTAATAIAGPNALLDGVLGVTLVLHSHLGFDQCLIDYVHDRKFPIIGPIARWTLRALTCGVLVGLYQFNTNDIGLTELIKKAWKA